MTNEEKKRFELMQQRLERVENKLDNVLNALKGDDLGQSKGLVSEVKELKIRLQVLEDIKKRFVWITIGAGVAGGMAIDKIISFIKSIFFVLILFLVAGCVSTEKKQANAYVYFTKNKAELTQLCDEKFPPKLPSIPIKGETIFLKDTVIINFIDSTTAKCKDGEVIKLPCPPTKIEIKEFIRVDTFYIENRFYKDFANEQKIIISKQKENLIKITSIAIILLIVVLIFIYITLKK